MRFCGQCGTSLHHAVEDSGRPAVKARIGERRLLTVMFCDLVGSTRLASTLEPEDLRHVLLAFREACASVVQRQGGTVGQYLGDGILAYFGHPRAREDDPQRALRAALQARSAISAIPSELARHDIRLDQPLGIRIGLHSGLVVVADLGKGRNAEAAAIVGETTSIAARLQAAAVSGSILTSEATARLAGDCFEFIDAGIRELHGVALPIRTFEVGLELRKGRNLRTPNAVRSGLAPFLARQAEMETLRANWANVVLGGSASVVIEAEAGMGKSRLVSEFRTELDMTGHAAVIFACSEEDRSTPYHPVLSWIRGELSLSNRAEADAVRNALRRALGQSTETQHELYLAALLDCNTAEEQNMLARAPRRRRRETVDALLAFLRIRLGTRGPHLVLIEDMHWVDNSTLGFVRTLVEQCLVNWQILLLLTTRSYLTVSSEVPWTVVRLERLTDEDARQLVRKLASSTMGENVIERIVQRTDGIPLFTEEVARFAAASAGATAGYSRSDSDIPLTLRGTLTAQLDGLGPAKAVAQLAAVIGRSFQLDVLEAVMEDPSTLGAALASLVEARLLELQPPASEANTYVFRHALIRDAAYDSILAERRRALHSRIGNVLRDTFPTLAQLRPEILAQHFALAGRRLDAADHYEAAARRAALRSTHAEAAEHCRAALTQLTETGARPGRLERETRLQILLAAQITASRGNADPAVREAFEKARDVAEAAGQLEWLQRALRGLHTFHLVQGDIGAGYQISRRVIKLARHNMEAGQRIQLHRPHGLTLLYMGRFEEARRELLIATSLYEPKTHAVHRFEYGSDPLVLARCHLGWAEWFLGDTKRAVVECQDAVSAARALDHPHSLAFALGFQACLDEFMDNADAARLGAEELVRVSEHHEYAYWSAWGRIVLGWSKSASGKLEEGEELLSRGLADYEATGAGLLVPYANMLLAGIVRSRDNRLSQYLNKVALQKANAGAMGIWPVLFKYRLGRRQQQNPVRETSSKSLL